MNNEHILHITAITEVDGSGQKCTQALLTYDKPVAPDVPAEAYVVEGRTITGISVDGADVTLYLSKDDENASTFHPGMFFRNIPSTLSEASVKVTQVLDIAACDGSILPAADADENDRVENLVADDFIQGSFEDITYNLYIPKDMEPGETYPLVQFIHDAGPCGPDTKLTLAQGDGAIVWARPEEQAKHKCFVLAPQFDCPAIVDDDWNVDPRLETEKRLLDYICENYPVDKNRIYTTGQSMGCMSSIVLNVRYPDLFAASYLVAGQWDERQIDGLEKQHLWMINSMGDAKAFPGMNQMCCEMESKGAKIARKIIDANASEEEMEETAKELIDTGANIIYTPYWIESVSDGWHSRGGDHHTTTWTMAYDIEPIHDWLFAQSK